MAVKAVTPDTAEPPSVSLKRHLLALITIAVIPIVLVSVGLISHLVSVQRQSMSSALLEKARSVSLGIDRELAVAAAVIHTIADSPLVDAGDIAGIHDFARRAVQRRPGSRIALVDPRGEQIFNTAAPLGTALPNVLLMPPALSGPAPGTGTGSGSSSGNVALPDDSETRQAALENIAAWHEVLQTGREFYSNLFVGALRSNLTLSYRAPVIRGGKIIYALAITFEPTELTALLSAAEPDTRRPMVLVDRRGIVIARNVSADHFVGGQASPTLLASMQRAPEGTDQGEALGGADVVYAYNRSVLTGWTVAAAVATNIAEATVRRSLIAWTAIVLALIGLGIWRARGTWHELGTPLRALAQNARAFEQGEEISLPRSKIREIQDCSHAWSVAITADQARKREEKLRHAADARRRELEQASHEKDRLLAALSHELRNPLAAIVNSARILEIVSPREALITNTIAIIRRQSEHLTHLVDDLLDLARVTFGKMQLERAPMDLLKLVRDTVSAYEQRTGGHAAIAVLGQPVWVDADAVRLSQVLRNLLDNALKFTPATGAIRVEVSTDQDDALLIVADNGAGVPPALIEQLFGAFVQNEQTIDRAQGGLGLGLALVRQIVELHGGKVSAASGGQGQGTVFTVRLRRCEAKPEPVTGVATVPRRRHGILVVEDQEDARTSLQNLLELLDQRVDAAATGNDGLAQLRSLASEIAFVDLGLPDIDGFTFARMVRADTELAQTRLIAMTGYSQPSARERALEAGFDEFLVKPVSPERLIQVLSSAPSAAQ